MGFFRFFRSSIDYISADESAVAQAGIHAERHLSYHKRVVLISGVFTALGVIGGLIGSVMAEVKDDRESELVFLGPLMTGAVGMLFGASLACLFAPKEFLTGPIGAKWMKLIGTRS